MKPKIHFCHLNNNGVLVGLVSVWGVPIEIELHNCANLNRFQQERWAVKIARKIYRSM